MAAFYIDCDHQECLNKLDYTTNRYLRYNYKSKWLKKFTFTTKDLKAFDDVQRGIEIFEEIIPPAFHWALHWFIIGLDGPFGQVSGYGTDHLVYQLIPLNLKVKTQRKPTFQNLKPHSSSLVFCQSDLVNCGVCCSMFLYDMIITQNLTSWKHDLEANGTLPKLFKFGSSVLKANLYQLLPNLPKQFDLNDPLLTVYQLFREE